MVKKNSKYKQKKTEKTLTKPPKIGLVCVQFYKTKTPQVKKRHPIQELSKRRRHSQIWF